MKVNTIQAGDFLRLSAQRFPDRDCFVFDDGSSRTFAETNRRVNQLAARCTRRGVRKGDRVAILGTDSGEYVEVLMACMKIGAVYVPLNNRLADAEVLTLLRRAEPAALFASSRYAARVAALARRAERRPAHVLPGRTGPVAVRGPARRGHRRRARCRGRPTMTCSRWPSPAAPPACPRACSSPSA